MEWKNKLMEQFLLASLIRIKKYLGIMIFTQEIIIQDKSVILNLLDLAGLSGRMEEFIMEFSLIMQWMDLEFLICLMEKYIKDVFLKINIMGLVF